MIERIQLQATLPTSKLKGREGTGENDREREGELGSLQVPPQIQKKENERKSPDTPTKQKAVKKKGCVQRIKGDLFQKKKKGKEEGEKTRSPTTSFRPLLFRVSASLSSCHQPR
mmetsp:Transcript_25487/g.49842  ORF Transcript_25487/g.49842 Transcript_25487/m.49842 type:complete len:114 (-) Transcript_25487:1112-1453(-)